MRTCVPIGRVARDHARVANWNECRRDREASVLCHYSRHIKHLLCLTLHLPWGSFAPLEIDVTHVNAATTRSHRAPLGREFKYLTSLCIDEHYRGKYRLIFPYYFAFYFFPK